ncbi:MAG: hypothetical protein FWH37_01430 [Candidatus Bathyarchaeota archaeon]|nr:hypothetical protein [Candidatus Termiticorpusculum sp.]
MGLGVVWFTVKERRWRIGFFGKFSWMGVERFWDSGNCTISIAKSFSNDCLIVVRSNRSLYSSFMGKKVVLRYMLSFEISKVPANPRTEIYVAIHKRFIKGRGRVSKKRWILQLDDKHWIWEWVQEGKDITNSTIYQLYCKIVKTLKQSFEVNIQVQKNMFIKEEEVLPVIYQPSVDALKNFVREIHCAKQSPDVYGTYIIEVSLLFNNERLRQHGLFNSIYKSIRYLIYGRTMDIETFKIHVHKNSADNYFTFEGIYSGHNGINADSTHGDKKLPLSKHSIKYYFINQNHPIVFINTSNHAMAEYDTNNKLWKWEYIPWLTNTPVKYGTLTRKELEKKIKKSK